MKEENSIKQQLFKLENLLLQPSVRKSTIELSKILSDEFIEFGSSGKIFSKQQIIDALQQESPIKMTIHNFEIKELAPNIMLATYQISVNDTSDKQIVTSLRSSIWKQFDKRWQMIFHQGTKSGIELK